MKKTNIFVSIGVLALVTVIIQTTFAIDQNRSMRTTHGGTFSKCKGSSIDGPDKFCKTAGKIVTYEVKGPVRNKCDKVKFDWDGPVKKMRKEKPFKLVLKLDRTQDFTGKLEITAKSKNVSESEVENCKCGKAKKETDLFELALTKKDVDDNESSSSSSSTDGGRVCPQDKFKLEGKIVGLEQSSSKEIKMRFRCQGTEWKSDSAIPGNDAVVKYEYGDVDFNGTVSFKCKVTPEPFPCRKVKSYNKPNILTDANVDTSVKVGKEIDIPDNIKSYVKNTISKVPLLTAEEFSVSLSFEKGSGACCHDGKLYEDGVNTQKINFNEITLEVGNLSFGGGGLQVDECFRGGCVDIEVEAKTAEASVALESTGSAGVRENKCGKDCVFGNFSLTGTVQAGPSAGAETCFELSYFDISDCFALGVDLKIKVGFNGSVRINSEDRCDGRNSSFGPTTPKLIGTLSGGTKALQVTAEITTDGIGKVKVIPTTVDNEDG